MNYTVDNIILIDDKTFEIFNCIAEETISDFKCSGYPATITCLVGLMGSINSLKLAAFDLAEESDTHLYAIKTLLRPAIEHFLRFSYLHHKLADLKNDSAGEEYRKYTIINETISAVKSQFALDEDKCIQIEILNEIKRRIPSFNLSNSELQKIVLKWSYKNIAKSLNSSIFSEPIESNFFKSLVSEYAELSSFVHGGVQAESYYHVAQSNNTLLEEVTKSIFLFSFLASTAISHVLMVAYHLNPKYKDQYLVLQESIQQLLNLKEC